jgi:uncharacterized protein YdaU (DUF1376 family)
VSGSLPMSIVALEELATASALTTEEYGAYTLLRLHQWQQGALPLHDDRLALIAHVATNRWPAVSAGIRPLFGPNWRHEPTNEAREKALASHERLSKAGQKGGRAKATAKAKPSASPAMVPAARQAASLYTSQATGLASAWLQPDALPRDVEASLSPQVGDQVPYPPIPDPEAARDWLLERSVFPADVDELKRLLMAGTLTPAILKLSAP